MLERTRSECDRPDFGPPRGLTGVAVPKAGNRYQKIAVRIPKTWTGSAGLPALFGIASV